MTEHAPIERSWPPQCCVPAFVAAALDVLGLPAPVADALPHVLGVKVAETDFNPLALPIARSPAELGVSAAAAAPRIEEILKELNAPFRFEHISLSAIPRDGLYEFAEDALLKGAILGVGVRYQLVDTRAPASALHVLRLSALRDDVAMLVDDSGEASPRHTSLPFDQVIAAARAAGDGFWIFHPPAFAARLN